MHGAAWRCGGVKHGGVEVWWCGGVEVWGALLVTTLVIYLFKMEVTVNQHHTTAVVSHPIWFNCNINSSSTAQ